MTFVRRDIWTLDPNDPIVEWYRKGVGILKEREPAEVVSWGYQAAIHGIPSGQEPLWNECQHAQWYFLPWHRMYLLRFEAIVRAAIEAAGGPANWALPYWNYGLNGNFATLPIPFREPEVNGEPNALYVQQRGQGVNEGWLRLPETVTSAKLALERPAFVGAAEFGGGESLPHHGQDGPNMGLLEDTPHGVVHSNLGGWMGDPRFAAKDPIFWLHHANIDRLWQEWNENPGRVDPDKESWTKRSFELFDTDGNQVPMTCEAVESIGKLGYEYDHKKIHPIPPHDPFHKFRPGEEEEIRIERPHMVGATERPITLIGEPVEVAIPIDAKEAGDLAPRQHVYMNTEDIKGERNPSTVYAVYVELPPDASPEVVAEHHVGNLSFFGIERSQDPAADEHPHSFRHATEITRFAQELAERGEWAGHELRVSIRPVTLEASAPEHEERVRSPAHPEAPITVGRISVFYDA